MGKFNCLDREPSREDFAEEVLRRIRVAGEQREVLFDQEAFALAVANEQTFHLGNAFETYKSTDTESHDAAFSVFVRTWFAYQQGLPDDFADLIVSSRDILV